MDFLPVLLVHKVYLALYIHLLESKIQLSKPNFAEVGRKSNMKLSSFRPAVEKHFRPIINEYRSVWKSSWVNGILRIRMYKKGVLITEEHFYWDTLYSSINITLMTASPYCND